MRSVTSYTIGLAGAGYTLTGLATLLYPTALQSLLEIPLRAANVISVSLLGFGAYYSLAGYEDNHRFFLISAAGRWAMVGVLWRHRDVGAWRQVAVAEAVGAVVTAGALFWDYLSVRRGRGIEYGKSD